MSEEPSEDHLRGRPKKKIFPLGDQKLILAHMRKHLRKQLPPNTGLYRKRIFGSLAQHKFGKYQGKFKDREFSDVDVLFVVDDDFRPPKSWNVQFECEKRVWIVYDVAEVPIEIKNGTIPVEVQYIVLTKTFARRPETLERAERWGIPLKKYSTKNKYIPL